MGPLTVDDAQLLRMAAEPPREAAGWLQRSRTFGPLIACWIVVLPLMAAATAPFDHVTAVTGLKAWATREATDLEAVLIPGLAWRDDATLFQPPLAAWLLRSIMPGFPPGSVAGILVLSTVALGLMFWLAGAWTRETAGPALGLAVVVVLMVHPWALSLARTGSSEALGLMLLTTTAWGLWGHWRTSRTLVSVRLLCAGLAWGGALLSLGPQAILFLGLIFVWQVLCPRGLSRPAMWPTTPTTGFVTPWELAIVAATGLAVGGWWPTMLLERNGLTFVSHWLASSDGLLPLGHPAANNSWLNSVRPLAALTGLTWLGMLRAVRRPTPGRGGPADGLALFALLWALTAIIGRLTAEIPGWAASGAARRWEAFGLIPLSLLAAVGLVAMLRREFSTRLVLASLTFTLGSLIWAWTGREEPALVVMGVVGLVFLASAPLSIGLRRTTLAWSEAEIRRWIQGYALVAVGLHVFVGVSLIWEREPQREVYARLRRQLLTTPAPDQISLVTSDREDDPAPLEYLLRSLFPRAKYSHSIGWDPALTTTIVAESREPRSRMLVVVWSRRELKFQGDVGTGWQVTGVIDQQPYEGRPFAVHRIEPLPSVTLTPAGGSGGSESGIGSSE